MQEAAAIPSDHVDQTWALQPDRNHLPSGTEGSRQDRGQADGRADPGHQERPTRPHDVDQQAAGRGAQQYREPHRSAHERHGPTPEGDRDPTGQVGLAGQHHAEGAATEYEMPETKRHGTGEGGHQNRRADHGHQRAGAYPGWAPSIGAPADREGCCRGTSSTGTGHQGGHRVTVALTHQNDGQGHQEDAHAKAGRHPWAVDGPHVWRERSESHGSGRLRACPPWRGARRDDRSRRHSRVGQ